MDRLTLRNSDGTYSQPTHITFEKLFYKFAEYEDLEEQGRLIILPCNVSDTYWVIKDEYTMCPKGLIRSMCDTGTCVRNEEYCESKVITKLQEGKFDTIANIVRCMYSGQFGKRVFLTKAEAENKLKSGKI